MRNVILCVLAGVTWLGMAAAQVGSPNPPDRGTPSAPAAPPQVQPAVAISSTVAQLDRAVDNTRVDLARLRVEKWKTDSAIKRQAEENINSLQRNMADALPAIEAQVRANPASVAAVFKLYRNLNALYDVLASVTESAGAFGPREEYQALANDAANIDTFRRSLADHAEQMANAADESIARLQAQLAQARQAAASAPPKKIIVDENEPVKKPARKKKKAPATSPPPK